MQHVEFVGDTAHLFEHQHVRGEDVADRRVEAQCARPRSFERRLRVGVAACEQGHVVPQVDERIGEVGHHALGAAIEFRRNGLVQRGNLCDSHWPVFLEQMLGLQTIPE